MGNDRAQVHDDQCEQLTATSWIQCGCERRGYGGAMIPWKVTPRHRHRHAARMLRTQDRIEAGLVVGSTLSGQVEQWRSGLLVDDLVIDYDPDTEEGFRRVPRRPGVDTGWVRDPSRKDST